MSGSSSECALNTDGTPGGADCIAALRLQSCCDSISQELILIEPLFLTRTDVHCQLALRCIKVYALCCLIMSKKKKLNNLQRFSKKDNVVFFLFFELLEVLILFVYVC